MADGNRKATWEDIMHLPENMGAEILGGKIYYKAMPRSRHAATHGRVRVALDRPTRLPPPAGWWIRIEEDIALGHGDTVRPDLAGWRKDRMAEYVDEWPTTVLPDWVCEILSPNNATYDRGAKMDAYALAGVPWMWIADPETCSVEVFQLNSGRWIRIGLFGGLYSGALMPFEDIVVAVPDLFPEPKAASAHRDKPL